MSTTDAGAVPADERLGRNKLNAVFVSAIVLSAVAPVSALAASAGVLVAVRGGATPASFVIAGLLYTVFSIGYVAMSRHMVNAGGFVAYVARAFGDRLATAAAAVTLTFYFSSLVAFYAISGVVAAGTLGLDSDPAVVTFGMLLLVGVLSYLGISVSARLLVALLLVEFVAVLVLNGKLLLDGGPEGYSLAGFGPDLLSGPGLGVSVLLCMICYSGLEATVVFSEEAKEPRRTIPRAVFGSLAIITVFYTLTSWLLTVNVGPKAAGEVAGADPGGFFFSISGNALGSGYTRFLEYLVVTSFLALFLGFQSMITRYVFALGRAGVLPSVLAHTHPRTKNPGAASITVTLVVGAILLVFTAAGADPILTTYSWLVGLGTVGLLCTLALVSLSVLVFFRREPDGSSPFVTLVAPALALVGLVTALVIGIENYDLIGSQDGQARLLLLVLPVVAAGGWLLAHGRSRRGLGVDYSANLES